MSEGTIFAVSGTCKITQTDDDVHPKTTLYEFGYYIKANSKLEALERAKEIIKERIINGMEMVVTAEPIAYYT